MNVRCLLVVIEFLYIHSFGLHSIHYPFITVIRYKDPVVQKTGPVFSHGTYTSRKLLLYPWLPNIDTLKVKVLIETIMIIPHNFPL